VKKKGTKAGNSGAEVQDPPVKKKIGRPRKVVPPEEAAAKAPGKVATKAPGKVGRPPKAAVTAKAEVEANTGERVDEALLLPFMPKVCGRLNHKVDCYCHQGGRQAVLRAAEKRWREAQATTPSVCPPASEQPGDEGKEAVYKQEGEGNKEEGKEAMYKQEGEAEAEEEGEGEDISVLAEDEGPVLLEEGEADDGQGEEDEAEDGQGEDEEGDGEDEEGDGEDEEGEGGEESEEEGEESEEEEEVNDREEEVDEGEEDDQREEMKVDDGEAKEDAEGEAEVEEGEIQVQETEAETEEIGKEEGSREADSPSGEGATAIGTHEASEESVQGQCEVVPGSEEHQPEAGDGRPKAEMSDQSKEIGVLEDRGGDGDEDTVISIEEAPREATEVCGVLAEERAGSPHAGVDSSVPVEISEVDGGVQRAAEEAIPVGTEMQGNAEVEGDSVAPDTGTGGHLTSLKTTPEHETSGGNIQQHR